MTHQPSPWATNPILWRTAHSHLHIAFLGQGWPRDVDEAIASLPPKRPSNAAYLRQIHSAEIQPAHAGECGEGDALISTEVDLGLTVVTADCVPILLALNDQIAAVHAGWRGLAQEILAATLARFSGVRRDIVAWIGPCIGSCCYEVGEEVADQVQHVTRETIRRPGRGKRPHIDLGAATRSQLEAGGVVEIHQVEECTRCLEHRWHSYRRNGPQAGRNLACIWRESERIPFRKS